MTVSCHRGGELNNARKEVTASLSGKVLQVKDFPAYRIFGSINGYLLCQADRDTSRVVFYRIEGDSLKYAAGIINKGRGPHEFIYVEFSLCKDTLFVSNSSPTGMSEIWGIPLNDIPHIGDINRWKAYKWSGQKIMTGLSFAKASGGKFIVAGGLTNTRHILSMVDFPKNQLNQFDLWPKDSTAASLFSKQMVYLQSHLAINDGKLFYACLEGRYMFITKIGEKSLGKPVYIYSHLPGYKARPDGNVDFDDDCEYGIFPYTTSRFIYAQLERNRKEIDASEEYKGYPWLYFDEIEVYDWKGKFIGNFRTDKPFSSFVVSPDDRFVYTLSIDLQTKEPEIIRYNLPKL